MELCLIPIKNNENNWLMMRRRINNPELFEKENNAAITIQRTFRLYIETKKINQIILEIYNDNAKIIQRAFRHYLSQKLKT